MRMLKRWRVQVETVAECGLFGAGCNVSAPSTLSPTGDGNEIQGASGGWPKPVFRSRSGALSALI